MLMAAMLMFFLLLAALIGVLLALVFAVLAAHEGPAGGVVAAVAGSVLFLLTLGVGIGLLALISLGFVIVAGPGQIGRRPVLRWIIVAFGALGIVEAA